MKIRNGFVSNSSSSSFLIASNESPVIKIEVPINGKIIESIEDFEEYILDEHGYKQTIEELLVSERGWLKKIYDAGCTAIKNGKKLCVYESDNMYNNPVDEFFMDGAIGESNFNIIGEI